MTGFGQAESIGAHYKIRVELKSLNGKFLELNLRTPKIMNEKDVFLRNHFGKKLIRGTIVFNVQLEPKGEGEEGMRLNKALATNYYKQIAALATSLGADHTSILNTVISLPEVLRVEEGQLENDDWIPILDCCEKAFLQMDNYRKEEGNELKGILAEHGRLIGRELLPQIEEFDAIRKEQVKERLMAATKELAGDISFDNNRFEQELIYYLEKLDISEEKNRLAAHCLMFEEELMGEASGKKLGFISQEMGREINTMGSKAYHAPMQKIVIQMKEELEKIKEQVLNVI
jgi:uncharacterized protein (TIGR00255 family)